MENRIYVTGVACFCVMMLAACHGNTSRQKTSQKKSKITLHDTAVNGTAEKREDTGRAVAVFRQNMDDKVSNNDFVVEIYPASKADQFRMVIHYGGNTAADEVTMLPKKYYKKIELRKGAARGECLMGFTDMEGKFNEMKLIRASGTRIDIKTLKAYYLTTD